jgi:hypothetical protein
VLSPSSSKASYWLQLNFAWVPWQFATRQRQGNRMSVRSLPSILSAHFRRADAPHVNMIPCFRESSRKPESPAYSPAHPVDSLTGRTQRMPSLRAMMHTHLCDQSHRFRWANYGTLRTPPRRCGAEPLKRHVIRISNTETERLDGKASSERGSC